MAAEQTHVLLVDDEPAICRALSLMLGRSGFRVSTALSGESASAIVRNERVDVLVVDLRIPDMRGDALFELSAAMQPHLRHRTLFTTGDITERAQELIDATGCPLLRKPFDTKDLIDWVKAAELKMKDQSA
jgi:two-component system, NtrC family, response regulator GlrR